jgi:CRP/FNR family transcriptional regulator
MSRGVLGKIYKDGQDIIKQGVACKGRYVIQSGQVEVVQSTEHGEQHLRFLKTGDFFGEMALFEKEVRSATIRAAGDARILKVDKKTLFRRIQEDPLLAVNLLQTMSKRIRSLSEQLALHEDDP